MSKQESSFVFSYRGPIHEVPWREIRVTLSKRLERGTLSALTITCGTVEKASPLGQTDYPQSLVEKQAASVGEDTFAKTEKRLTMVDIAREANVSIATVSRVLNNTCPVNPILHERVEAAVKRLGYKPNEAARALVQRKCEMMEARLGSHDIFAIVGTRPSASEPMSGKAPNLSKPG